jgi:hypothetical protein
MSDSADKTPRRDRWEKAAIILEPVGGLLTALAVAGLGFFGSQFLNQRSTREAKLSLYTQLMSTREESEAALRKDMFQSIITSFLAGQSHATDKGASPISEAEALEAQVLNLELLAQNFHESLSLTPLFYHVQREIIASKLPVAAKREFEGRLTALGREVSRQQMAALEDGGARFDLFVPLDSLPMQFPGQILRLDGITRRFTVSVDSVDRLKGTLRVNLSVEKLAAAGATGDEMTAAIFEVSPFDAPMIDNLRLSDDQRIAVVLTHFNGADGSAELAGLYFPASHAGIREKPYYEDILRKLGDTALTAGSTSTPPR